MLTAARAKRFDAVVMMAPDRGAREMFRGGLAFFELYETGVKIYFYNKSSESLKLDTPTEKLVFQIEMFGSEHERVEASTRTLNGKATLHRAGFSNGAVVYGYRSVPTGSDPKKKLARYEIVEAEAAVIRRAFALAAEGFGDLRITQTLTAEAAPLPKRAPSWSKETIRTMLSNELYRGVLIYGKTRQAAEVGGVTKKRVAVPMDDWKRVAVPDCQIITDELWSKVQRRKAQTRQHYIREADGRIHSKPESGLIAEHLLNGIARCGVCGGPLTFTRKNGYTRRYYCSAHQRRGTCDNSRGVPMAALDKVVKSKLAPMLTEDVTWELYQERRARFEREWAARNADRPDMRPKSQNWKPRSPGSCPRSRPARRRLTSRRPSTSAAPRSRH